MIIRRPTGDLWPAIGTLSPLGQALRRRARMAVIVGTGGDVTTEWDHARKQRMTSTNTPGTDFQRKTFPWLGQAMQNVSANGWGGRFTGRPALASGDVTLACIIGANTINDSACWPLGTSVGTSTGAQFRTTNTGILTLRVAAVSSSTTLGPPVAGSQPWLWIASFSDSRNRVRLLAKQLNSGEIGTADLAHTGVLGHDGTFYVGGSTTSGNGRFNHIISAAWIIEDYFSMDMLRAWAADPYVMHRMARPLIVTAAPETVEADLTEGAEAGDSFAERATLRPAVTDGAEAGETFAAARTLHAAVTEGGEAGEVFAAILHALEEVTDGALAGDTVDALATLRAAAAEGARAGDVEAALLRARASMSEGAIAGETFAALIKLVREVEEGAQAGESYTVRAVLRPASSEGAVAGDSYTARLVLRAAISEGAEAGDRVAFGTLGVGPFCVHVEVLARNPGLTFTTRNPTISRTQRNPDLSVVEC